MKQSEHSSRLFLTELLISLSLFVISAAVCVALLVHARGMSLQSTRLTQAVYLAQSAAETWRVGGAPTAPVQDESGLTVSLREEGAKLTVSVYRGDELIYSLEGVERLG